MKISQYITMLEITNTENMGKSEFTMLPQW